MYLYCLFYWLIEYDIIYKSILCVLSMCIVFSQLHALVFIENDNLFELE